MNCEQSSLEESRWSNVEVLLKSVIQKNQELEMKIQHMEAEIKAQKLENAEMKTRLQILENKQHADKIVTVQESMKPIKYEKEQPSNGNQNGVFEAPLSTKLVKKHSNQPSAKTKKLPIRKRDTVTSSIKRKLSLRTVL